MGLVREELYKIGSRRIVKISFGVMLAGIVFFFLMSGPWNERCSIGNERAREDYYGFAAIGKDRELAAEFEGVLTDETVSRMAEKCFFQEYSTTGIVTNGNYVNAFFTENGLTDGVPRGPEIVPATRTIPIEETVMGDLSGGNIYFTYIRGWQVFKELFQVGMLLEGVFVIIALSSVFSEEYTLKTVFILLTTAHGKQKGLWAKLAAGVLFSTGVFCFFTGFMALLCGCCYGFQGLSCMAGMLEGSWWPSSAWLVSVSCISIGSFFVRYFLLVYSGLLVLTLFALFASAVSGQNFTALILGLIFFFLPTILWIICEMLYGNLSPQVLLFLRRFIFCSPIYSFICGSDLGQMITGTMLTFRAVLSAVTAVSSVVLARWRYRNYEG